MSKNKQNQHTITSQQKKAIAKINPILLIFLFSITIFLLLGVNFDVTQDDAYISFRYASNYLAGNGLVYNSGEKVEGYTNFLWIMIMIIAKGLLGIDYLLTTRFLGILLGELIFFLIYLLFTDYFKKIPPFLYLSAVIALLGNLSFLYWSSSSLETSAFACISLCAIIIEKRKPLLVPAILAIATLLRPEGVILFLVILIYRIITKQNHIVYYILTYAILILPFGIFKIAYYGSLIPNTYFAKSGFEIEYLQNGLEYVWQFIKNPAVYGIVLIIPLLVIKKLWKQNALLYLYVYLYLLYIVVVGGDVLRVYRFFIPIIPVLCFLFVISISELATNFKLKTKIVNTIVIIIVMLYSTLSYSNTYEYIKESQLAELQLINNMHLIGHMLKKHMGNDFSVAASTIGMLGYQLVGHRVIDMLGLTDPYIARNPETIAGMKSGWKERRFNSRYLLEQQPDFIIFSTGYKPSAPAERALMLHSEFRNKYSPIGFFNKGMISTVWKRNAKIDISQNVIHPDVEFVNKMNDGMNNLSRLKLESALADFQEARERLKENYSILNICFSNYYFEMGKYDSALVYAEKVLSADSLSWLAQANIIKIALELRDSVTAINKLEILKRQHPWLFDRSYQPPKDIRLIESLK